MLRRSPARSAAIPASDERCILLERIHAAHCLLDVRCAGHAAQSALVEVVPQQAYLVLDAFAPALDDALLARTPALAVRTRLDGLEIRFDTRVLERGGTAAAPYYMAAWPDDIDYPQRRREFRAVVPLDLGATVIIAAPRGAPVSGQLRDLSPSGFSLDLASEACERLALADGWRGRCQLLIGGEDTLAAVIEICHVRPPTRALPVRVGACFVDLDARSERRIERYVAELERARARLR
ncbi:MAG: flagellar regulator YcgR PilZN domain-containing protein [Gammaproteobacteria bacterium]